MKNFIFVFSLFAIFLTVNAAQFQLNKRAATFQRCPADNYKYDLLTVAMHPDPLISNETAQFNVSGTLTKNDITLDKTVLRISFADMKHLPPISDPYFKTFNKSYAAGTPFSIYASDVSVPTLPDLYHIIVVVGVPTDNPNITFDIYGCAFASVGSAVSFK
ncbi:hypothetical protein F8M41_018069 [Gigaspora margarita]|uniref:MD-2-related lipid-recognition domain-containing protein n=1 Tax=Gigaspora margarita TaxID=4874 RepID=A0A8H4ELP9_GIGMA|nr:hypothetical protein F8M41_018069 [Gigaspora margarita]